MRVYSDNDEIAASAEAMTADGREYLTSGSVTAWVEGGHLTLADHEGVELASIPIEVAQKLIAYGEDSR